MAGRNAAVWAEAGAARSRAAASEPAERKRKTRFFIERKAKQWTRRRAGSTSSARPGVYAIYGVDARFLPTPCAPGPY
ncbi:hypothetical protein GCM10022406_02980 [Hymenobacter algoricola]|uniref:Uncharacterized protein n=1 Tax=Hymenobacter algoricola TaxID=486267 RepID=A0ABP7MF22_9BACT